MGGADEGYKVARVMCRVDFHTQLADKANTFNSEDVKQLLQAVYDIMAPEGGKHRQETQCLPAMSLPGILGPEACDAAILQLTL